MPLTSYFPQTSLMILEFTRLALGLLIALFHVQLADFLREQDLSVAAALRQRGVPIPGALPCQAARDLFFVLGILVSLLSLFHIWMTLR
jgi:hypothetical protein